MAGEILIPCACPGSGQGSPCGLPTPARSSGENGRRRRKYCDGCRIAQCATYICLYGTGAPSCPARSRAAAAQGA